MEKWQIENLEKILHFSNPISDLIHLYSIKSFIF